MKRFAIEFLEVAFSPISVGIYMIVGGAIISETHQIWSIILTFLGMVFSIVGARIQWGGYDI